MPETINYDIGEDFLLNGRICTITRVIEVDRVLVQFKDDGKVIPATTLELQLPSGKISTPVKALDGINEKDMEIARERYTAIKPLLLIKHNKTKAFKERAEQTGIGKRTLERWVSVYTSRGHLSDLTPGRNGMRKARISRKVETIIKDCIERFYLTKQKLSQVRLYQEICRACKAAKLNPPSMNTVRDRIQRIKAAKVTKRRHGNKTARDAYGMAPGKFPGATHPLSVVQVDHTRLDLDIVDDEYRQSIGRPWMTVAIDVYSRMITGFYLSLETPNAFTVGMVIQQSVLRKENELDRLGIEGDWPVWGKMQKLHFDNGKDFRSNTVLTACEEHGIDVDYRKVKTPEYGGHIERVIGTIGRKAHEMPGTTFSNILKKGEYKSEKEAAVSFRGAEKALLRFIVNVYHQSMHEGIGMTPLQKWKEGILGTDRKVGTGIMEEIMDPERFAIDFLPYDTRAVRKEGIVWDNILYSADCLGDWRGAKKGGKTQEFVIRRDPRDISVIHFFDPTLKTYLPIPYRYEEHPSISLWQLKAVKKRLKKKNALEVDEDAIFGELELIGAEILEETRVTKTTRRNAQRLKNDAERLPKPKTTSPKLIIDNTSDGDDDSFELTAGTLTPRWRD